MSDPSLVMRLPGQVPLLSTPAAADQSRLGFGDPTAFGNYVVPDRDPDQPLTFASAVADLGMDSATQRVWAGYLSDMAAQLPDEVGFRSALVERMRGEGMPPPLRKALLQRGLKLYRAKGQRRSAPQYGNTRAVMAKSQNIYARCRRAIIKAAGVEGGINMLAMTPFVDEFGTGVLAQALYDAIDDGQLDFDGNRFSAPIGNALGLEGTI